MLNLNQTFYSPEEGGGGPDNKDKIELEKIKSEVTIINPKEPNYEGIEIGIEITTPGFEGINLDHHKDNDTPETPSAIEQALEFDLSKVSEGKMATVRQDLDSLGAMAVLMLRKENKNFDENLAKAIGILDRLGPKVFKEQGQELLKIEDKDWTEANQKLRAAYYKVFEERKPIEENLLFVKKLLTNEVEDKEIEELYLKDKESLEEARKNSKIELFADNTIAFIEGTHKRAMEIGYENADIIVAYNPKFDWGNGIITPKFTIARRDNNVDFDIKKLLERLKKIDPKWGGQQNIIGSPIGKDPLLTPEQIKNYMEEVMLEDKIVSLRRLENEITLSIKDSNYRRGTAVEEIKKIFGLRDDSTLGDLEEKMNNLKNLIKSKEERLKQLRELREEIELRFKEG
ncbi:MAG TPA: hypothetical protein PK119_00780 [Candidatus Paceibacterota bacterium]|nr:hypothetical protein [Candidatus Paceibacterota bacterium]